MTWYPQRRQHPGPVVQVEALQRDVKYEFEVGNLPFNNFYYAEPEVFVLYSHEHKSNYTPTERIGAEIVHASGCSSIRPHTSPLGRS